MLKSPDYIASLGEIDVLDPKGMNYRAEPSLPKIPPSNAQDIKAMA
jgi:hypothetical protein